MLGGGIFDKVKGLVVAPLQQLSFWKMKDRARAIGESGAHALLVRLMKASRPETRFHLMGHSFGCIVVSATVAGAPKGEQLPRPVDSLFLVQGALSLWSYCRDIPMARGTAGYFNRTLKRRAGARPDRDDALAVRHGGREALSDGREAEGPGRARRRAAEVRRHRLVRRAGLGALAEDREMGAADTNYGFQPGRVYNLDANGVIKNGGGFSGAHSDIAHPEVAHAFWAAVLVADTSTLGDSTFLGGSGGAAESARASHGARTTGSS